MAFHHPRILYPLPTNATLCLTKCDDACQFYGMCSPPPSYSSLPLNSTPDTTTIQFHHGSTLLPNLLIAAASVVAAALILLVAFYALLRFRRRRRRHVPSAAAAESDGDDDLFEMGGADVHHVWYISTVGSTGPLVGTSTAGPTTPATPLLGADDDGCLVYPADFRWQSSSASLHPAFHVHCIDTWLRSHFNCPLCRAPIVGPATTATAALPSLPPPPSSFLTSTTDRVDPNSSSSRYRLPSGHRIEWNLKRKQRAE